MNPTPAQPAPSSPGPIVPGGPRDLLLLILGLLAGFALGPGILGSLAPDLYDRLFVGSGPGLQQVQQVETERLQLRQKLIDTGVTDTAVQEFDRQTAAQLRDTIGPVMLARQQHRQQLDARLHALLLAVLAVVVLEALLPPAAADHRARLATARYALLALWLAITLAEPSALNRVSLLFVALVIAVALVAALVPLRRRP
jgi:hypothetical protein